MIRFVAVVVLLVACSSDDGVDEGTPVPACHECGPGAVRAGRAFSSLWIAPLVANRAGTVAGVSDDGLVWLRDDFTVEQSMPFVHEDIGIALDDAGGGAVTLSYPHDPGSPYSPKPVIAFAPDHRQMWNAQVGALDIGSPAASSDVIAASVFRGAGPGLIGLRVADGSIAWDKQLPTFFFAAFAPDGTLVVTGYFSGTLDLGGATTPLVAMDTDLYVAAIDPLTGDARWAIRLDVAGDDGGEYAPLLGVGSAGEIAIWNVPGSLTLIDAAGTVRWTLPLETHPTALVPDGDNVLTSSVTYPAASSGFESVVAQYSASGAVWQRTITGSQHQMKLLALAGGRLIAAISKSLYAPGPVSITIGDVMYEGNGVAIVELAH